MEMPNGSQKGLSIAQRNCFQNLILIILDFDIYQQRLLFIFRILPGGFENQIQYE